MVQKSLRTHLIAIIVITALSVFSGLAFAKTYSNAHNGSIMPFGAPDTTSYGQVFNGNGGILTDWSFYASSGNAGNLQLMIADWNGSYAVGPALYTSSIFSYSGGSQVFHFNGININLATDDYIAFITVAGLNDAASSVFMAGSRGNGGLGGGFTFANTNGINPLSLGSDADWESLGNWGPGNMQFTAVIAVPEPETYAMILAGLGVLGWTFHRRKKNNKSSDYLARVNPL